ncbi:hypothetical protein GM418_26945 [Maribellus comscasis]|uniref:Uncharacterized protein n=1 Tax=Maribellus comscasis TaxID=2681766 RepID=A0A6I6K151_9BACT|nr:DUF6132 family protein [Maribellus comscasis]QGY47168.1 hypothetical protein GM418_26945 [Maribellus comscasis]
MKNLVQKYKVQIGFALAGAIGGFLYWRFVGCLSGTCPIRSVWYWSTMWGTAVGYLAGDFINDILVRRKNKKEENSERKVSEHN